MTEEQMEIIDLTAKMGYYIKALTDHCKKNSIRFEDIDEETIIRIGIKVANAFFKSSGVKQMLREKLAENADS